MIRTRHGSCHCGAVRFSCEIDLSPEGERSLQLREGPWYASTLRCNCSWCGKTRIWKSHVPAEAFALLQGADHITHTASAARPSTTSSARPAGSIRSRPQASR